MNLWSLPLIAGLSLALPLVPNPAEAPEVTSASVGASFDLIGEYGFSYRWLSEETIKSGHMECNFYALCSFADIVGPSCPHEIFVALDYFDVNGDLITSGGDVLPSSGRQRHIHVELGSNNIESFDTFEVSDVGCYLGLPTGKPDI
jgi:hypothetical protein